MGHWLCLRWETGSFDDHQRSTFWSFANIHLLLQSEACMVVLRGFSFFTFFFKKKQGLQKKTAKVKFLQVIFCLKSNQWKVLKTYSCNFKILWKHLKTSCCDFTRLLRGFCFWWKTQNQHLCFFFLHPLSIFVFAHAGKIQGKPRHTHTQSVWLLQAVPIDKRNMQGRRNDFKGCAL